MRRFRFLCTLAVSAALFAACSSSEKKAEESMATQNVPAEPLTVQLSRKVCPSASDFRGTGVAETPQAALLIAQKEIAAQISSSIESKSVMAKSQEVDALGNEIIEESYKQKTKLSTTLSNAQDAKSVETLVQGQQFGVLACMSQSDAAKPYLATYAPLKDSVMLLTAMYGQADHPLNKATAFNAARDVFTRLLSVRHIILGLGISPDELDKDKMVDPAHAFTATQQAYKDFRAGYGLHYKAETESNLYDLLFTRMSAAYNIKQSECESGLMLVAKIADPSCKEGSLGITCNTTISLTGSSCSGEPYFSLSAQVKGNGRYDEAEAMDKISKNIANGDWFTEWQKDLDKWSLK